ncbi:DUF4407 domain-containing protein [Kitasatospora sp. NBC_01539]|uniref:DUF4407 domain-containing protein n=1 Tax=Kitasatospora sp. NBC_01539 TaxID=2903577 RepID=UPI0038601C53
MSADAFAPGGPAAATAAGAADDGAWAEVRGAEPEARPPRAGTRFLRWAAATDPGHLLTRSERTRAAAVGTLMVLVASMAAASAAVLMTLVAGGQRPWTVPVALAWGVLVFCIDRAVLAETDYGDLSGVDRRADLVTAAAAGAADDHPVPPSRTGRGRLNSWITYPLRIALALLVAVLIGESVCLVVFEPEIRQVLARDAGTAHRAETAGKVDASATALQDAVARRERQMADNDALADAAARTYTDANTRYYQEINNPGRPGYGALAEAERRKVTAALADRQAAAERRDRDNADLRAKNRADQATVTALRTPGSPEYRAVEAATPAKAGADGWLAREHALRTFRQENRHDPTVRWLPWLIRGLLLLVDVLPLVLKALGGKTLHHRRRREQAELVRYADRVEFAAAVHAIDLAVDQKLRRTRLAADLARARDERFREHRTDHLGRPGP